MEEFDIHVTKDELITIKNALSMYEMEVLSKVSPAAEKDNTLAERERAYKLERLFSNFPA